MGVTPFEMLVGWKFRGTFPCLWSKNSQELDRADIREKDAVSKLESKIYADTRRGAKFSDIVVGDRVLIAQQKKHKSDPTFSADRFTVIARDGAKVVVQSDRGIQYSRNVQDVKRVPAELEGGANQLDDIHEEEDGISSSHQDDYVADNQDLTIERPRRIIKKPNRFKDMILFSIFE